MKPVPVSAGLLSLLAAFGATLASVVTLAWDGAFPAPPMSTAHNIALAEARGWSMVTIGLVLPAMLGALVATRRGSLSGRMVWLGALAYLLYTYLEFAVSPPFSPLYLVYVTTFAAATTALCMGVSSVDVERLVEAAGDRIPRRWIAGFALFTAIGLALAWLEGIVIRTLAGDFGWPQGEAAIGHVVHALDLGLQVPLGLATGVLLLRRRPVGHLVAAIMLVNAVGMGFALTAMVAVAAVESGDSVATALAFVPLPLAALALSVAFFRAIREVPRSSVSRK